MARLFRICLLLLALGGLIGQSAAMAMAPGPMTVGPVHAATPGMDCTDLAKSSAPGKMPCKKMTLQCMAAMGCAPAAFVRPDVPNMPSPLVGRVKSTLSPAARLRGRSYGPEPDPPSFLI